MAFGIYKQGQGYWTRLMTFLGLLLMFAWGGSWVKNQVEAISFARPEGATGTDPALIWGWSSLIALVFVGAVLSYWIAYSKAGTGEFFIATEGEMKKVNWSSRKEVMGSTWVVIGVSLFLALVLLLVDLVFSTFFKGIGILDAGA